MHDSPPSRQTEKKIYPQTKTALINILLRCWKRYKVESFTVTKEKNSGCIDFRVTHRSKIQTKIVKKQKTSLTRSKRKFQLINLTTKTK